MPLLLPFAPEVIVTHEILLTVVQLHPFGAVTLTVPDRPPNSRLPAGKFWLVGLIEKVQPEF